MRAALALLATTLLAACGGTDAGSGNGGAGQGGNGPGQTELSDGTMGSSCGTCESGLQCAASGQIPNGYCSRTCATEADCGSLGHCVPTASGSICFRGCAGDSDCRPGYACKDAGAAGSVCDVGTPVNVGGSGGGGSGGDCATVISPAVAGNGCAIRLVTPPRCADVDLSNGQTYEFAWTTDGTFCETPFKLIVVGNPPSEANAVVYSYSTNYQNGMISNYGGLDRLGAGDVQAVTSTDGIYHWWVQGYYGSHPDSIAFRLTK